MHIKVLVADDSKPIRERLIERLYRLPGMLIAEAVDTASAIDQVQTFSPDVAVLDIRMPGGGGIKALQAIKRHRPGLPIIIMTNYPYAQYRRKCLEAGADFFFDKSTEFEEVAQTVARLAKAESPADIALKVVSSQLVNAREQLERAEQRRHDMSILSLLQKPGIPDHTYTLWEKTFDAIPDLIAIFDANHRIVRVNRAMADRFGIPAAELTGKKCYRYMHGADCPLKGCPHELMLHDGREHSVELHDEASGSWLYITVSPIYEDARLIGAIHVARDITDRKRAEQALKDSEQRYRHLFESMDDGFALHEMICDENGTPVDYRFLEVNPGFEKLTGMRATDLIGRTVKQVIPEIEPYWIDFYGQVALSGIPAHTEQYSQVFNRYYTVTAYSPRTGQFATIFSDASERHRAEETMKKAFNEAESANRAKTQFLANMSHELRTPLNAIIGLSELLQDSPLQEDQLDYVKTINTSGEALLSIIADLLDLSKIELGRIELRHAPFPIRAAVDHVLSVLKPFAQQKNLDLSVRVSDAVPDRITGDTDRLQQVLINIINNALKFTQQGSVRLSVDALQTPGGSHQVVFEVEDSGIGMDKETMMRIFEPFQQGDASITREHGGTGLGLSICRSLVNLMGGTIHVASDKGHGSIFRFYITDSSDAEDLSVNETLLAACRGKTVCLWDDDPENLHALEYLLGQYGIRVFFGAGIKEVPLCLQETPPPDAVFCNLDVDGMRENLPVLLEGKPQIPLIAVSRWIVPLTDSMKPAFDGFLDKPVRPAQVTELLTRLFL